MTRHVKKCINMTNFYVNITHHFLLCIIIYFSLVRKGNYQASEVATYLQCYIKKLF